MVDMWRKLLGYATNAFDMLLGVVEALFVAVSSVVGSITFLHQAAQVLPSFLGAAVICFVAIYAIKFLTGR